MTDDLLPCPFCGSRDALGVTDHDGRHDPSGICWVECDNCGTEGPFSLSGPQAAARLWNTRAIVPEPA